jgi:DNA-binding protein YbaB
MRPERQARIDELLQQYRHMRDNLGAMQREMTELTATAESPGGAVRATVDYRGNLSKLEINPRAYRSLDSTTMGEQIVETAKMAARQVQERVREVVSPNVPDVAGLSVIGGDFDFTKLFPEKSEDLPGIREPR